jgi:hypothetical protein
MKIMAATMETTVYQNVMPNSTLKVDVAVFTETLLPAQNDKAKGHFKQILSARNGAVVM